MGTDGKFAVHADQLILDSLNDMLHRGLARLCHIIVVVDSREQLLPAERQLEHCPMSQSEGLERFGFWVQLPE